MKGRIKMTKVDRRKKINIMLNDEERRIIKEKAQFLIYLDC